MNRTVPKKGQCGSILGRFKDCLFQKACKKREDSGCTRCATLSLFVGMYIAIAFVTGKNSAQATKRKEDDGVACGELPSKAISKGVRAFKKIG